MKNKSILLLIMMILMGNLNAQVVNSGGGGPSREDQIEKEAKEVIRKREEKLKILKEQIKEWVKKAKGRWETCHGEKIEAKNIIDLYLVISLKEATSEFRETCRRNNNKNCMFKNKQENEKLKDILQNEMFDDYLISKGLKGKNSRKDLKSFYLNKIKEK